ncbi:MAG TPA: extracellular solute-binding protein [Sphingomonas sp.]|nr:extracellular solute-binding protein [Sphingomonas sp.]
MRGMTWDHSRGYDPLAAAARVWAERTGVTITWDRRSLQDFESYPVETLAREYDLIVIDHPHVGGIAEAGCLVPFEGDLDDIADGSIGGSFESYCWQGRQWALPIDAAAQVQAWAPGRIDAAVSDWRALAPLVADGSVAIPLRAPHSLMSLFTLCGLEGVRPDVNGPELFPVGAARACARLAEIAASVDPAMYDMDPIAVLEAMADPGSRIAVAPLIYGYVSYAVDGFRPVRLAFADIPALDSGPAGATLGGTGIAVSAYGADPVAAAAFARWVASGAVQRDLFASNGGQPAHAAAWEADGVNAAVGDFYRGTRATLDHAFIRPRHAGYMAFQEAASLRLNDGLRGGEAPEAIVAALNALHRESRQS